MPIPTSFTLNTGATIPAIGFGTWQAKPLEVERAVEHALKSGYRHIDCAAIYRNESEVGNGIKNSGVPRSDIFITSKLWNTKHAPEDVEPALDKTLKDLGTHYVDLYLMHWPVAFKPGDKWFPIDDEGVFQLADIDPAETYKAMERLLETGKVRAIGVCNFNIRRLEDLLSKTTVIPAVNQIELHPYLPSHDVVDYCKSKGMVVEAYSPLGNNQLGLPKAVDDPAVQQLAEEMRRDAGSLLYSWGLQRGTVVLPKSVTPWRIESNLRAEEIGPDAVRRIDALGGKIQRFGAQAHWGFDHFDEIGEERVKQIAREAGPSNLEKFKGV